jgi:superfamily II DNA or RNA helicase
MDVDYEEFEEHEDDPFDALLKQSFGYPLDEGEGSTRLKPIPEPTKETIVGACYWIHESEDWASKQPWYASLMCQPQKNSLAPCPPKPFAVFYTHESRPGWIGIPRFLGIGLFGIAKDVRSIGLDAPLDFCARPLRDYQVRARDASLKRLEEWGGATIIADCGAGKTAMALSIAASLKRKTLVLCNRTFLMQQWKYDIVGKGWTWDDDSPAMEGEVRGDEKPSPPREGWIPTARVGWLQGAPPSKYVDTTDKDIVIGSIDSLSQCLYARDMIQEFGLVIVDEMHHLGALTLSQVLPKLPARYVLGISATPDRNDGLEHVLYWLAGPTSFVYKRLPSITGKSGTVVVNQTLFTAGSRKEIVYKNGSLGYAQMVTLLAQDTVRNEFLIQTIRDLLDSRRKILIVTTLVDHAKFLTAQFDAALVYGGCKKEAISKAKSNVPIVVATYQFLEEGYDDETLDTLVMALPRSKIQQVVGRCERTHIGKLVPLIIDVVDTFSVFEAMSWKRMSFYKSRGFTIKRV